jgi:hypothetical protein
MIASRLQLQSLHETLWPLPPIFGTIPPYLGMRGDPWRIIVAAICVEEFGERESLPALRYLLSAFPSPLSIARLSPASLSDALASFAAHHNCRGGAASAASRLTRMSILFLTDHWSDVLHIPGAGQLAADAVAIFSLHDYTSPPRSNQLRRWFRAHRIQQGEQG